MKNIVVLTGAYYPSMSSPSACIDKYLQELKSTFRIHVVCIAGGDCSVKLIDGINIYYVSNWYNDFRIWIKKHQKANPQSRIYSLLYFFTQIYGVIISYFTFPTRRSWLKKKYRETLNNINSQYSIDAIISISNPVCSHLAAKSYKKKEPGVKWITYSTDPFTYYGEVYQHTFSRSIRKWRNKRCEKGYYDEADYNIFTEELYVSAIRDFNQPSNKTLCFPYVLKDVFRHDEVKEAHHNTINLIYAGALNKVIRNPEFMLSVIKKTTGLYFSIYQSGDCNDIIEKYKADFISIHGLVGREKYLELLDKESDVLINIGNNSEFQAPSKMFELLSTGKPIINFYYSKDKQYEMIAKYPYGLNIGKETVEPECVIEGFCQSMKGKRLSFREVEEIFYENSIQAQLPKLVNIIQG